MKLDSRQQTKLSPVPDSSASLIKSAYTACSKAVELLEEAIDNAKIMKSELENLWIGKKTRIDKGSVASGYCDPSLVITLKGTTMAADCARISSSLSDLESIYLIIREALLNIRKHAKATSATLTIDCFPEALLLKVIDDGIGAKNQMSRRNTSGVHDMKRRAEEMGGHLEVASPETGGTIVSLSLPIRKKRRGVSSSQC